MSKSKGNFDKLPQSIQRHYKPEHVVDVRYTTQDGDKLVVTFVGKQSEMKAYWEFQHTLGWVCKGIN
jgi:hypothetical protein